MTASDFLVRAPPAVFSFPVARVQSFDGLDDLGLNLSVVRAEGERAFVNGVGRLRQVEILFEVKSQTVEESARLGIPWQV